jgi:hypothetical protein
VLMGNRRNRERKNSKNIGLDLCNFTGFRKEYYENGERDRESYSLSVCSSL